MTRDTGDVRNAVAGAAVECKPWHIAGVCWFFRCLWINRIDIQGNGKFIDSGSGMVCVPIEEVCGSDHSIAFTIGTFPL